MTSDDAGAVPGFVDTAYDEGNQGAAVALDEVLAAA